MKRTRTAAVLVVTLFAVPLAGCASMSAVAAAGASGNASASAVETEATTGLPEQDITRWVMPMDQYSAPMLSGLTNYAENRRMDTCLSDQGFSWPIPVEPTDEASYLAFPKNPSSFPTLTVDIAKQFGYSANYMPGIWLADGNQTFTKLNRIAESSPGFEPVFLACTEESRKTFDAPRAADIENTRNGWLHEGRERIAQDPAVQKASSAWKQCITEAGYDVGISAPIGGGDEAMPTQKLGVELGFYAPPRTVSPQSPDGPSRPYNETEVDPDAEGPLRPIPAEIDLAVADATCRDSSGWTEAVYAAEWNAELAVIQNHAEELERMKAESDALIEQAHRIIDENPPLH